MSDPVQPAGERSLAAEASGSDLVRLVRAPIDVAALCSSLPQDGGLCLFLGTVRNHNAGRAVLRLEYEAYEEMALAQMRELAAETRRLHPVSELRLVHRLGSLEVGEVAVVVAVTGPHRQEVFAACRHAIDALKARVPIWKKEHYADGCAWIEPSPDP
jgi:molybdopterin synthase catalytic subunit